MTASERLIRPLIRRALQEDVRRGDLTTNAVVPPGARIRADVRAKAAGIVAGVNAARWVFETVDRRIRCTAKRKDGHAVRAGQVILTLHGPARSILTAERTALNFLGHLSGVATLTRAYVRRAGSARIAVLDTRKTIPGLRMLEKDAVRAGGGQNHRRGLDDAVLIKTNHLKAISNQQSAVSKNIPAAVRQAKRRAKGKTVEIEVTNLREFMAALHAKPDVILLDNWALGDIRKAVTIRKLVPRHSSLVPLLEVSGGVTLANIRAIAKTGVERISIGRLTHSAPALDVSLEVTSDER